MVGYSSFRTVRLVFIIAIIFVGILILPTSSSKRVLVVGGTGRVGSSVVSKLVSQGVGTNVLVRDLKKAENIPKLAGATLFEGNVNNVTDLVYASEGCEAVISTHGVSPTRFSKLRDIFIHPRYDLTHPYNVNYIGTKKILAAMQINGLSKFVRVTGALTGKNPFLPFATLFNILLSKTLKWHELSEIDIQKSGIDYTIVKPTEIVSEQPKSKLSGKPLKVCLTSMASGKSFTKRSSICVDDVAELCVRCVDDNRYSKSSMNIFTSNEEEAPEGGNDWNKLMDESSENATDVKPKKWGRHNLAIFLYTSLFAATFTTFTIAVVKLLKMIARFAGEKFLAKSVF